MSSQSEAATGVDPINGNTLFTAPWEGDGWHAVYEVLVPEDGEGVRMYCAQRPPQEALAAYIEQRKAER